jgi:hypothetical protein
MFDEPALASALAEAGYRRVRRHVYRAEWSTEVEHFIYFQLYGTPKDYLGADFGIRNKQAEIFAIRSLQAYGGPLERLLRPDYRNGCFMRFPLSDESWGLRSSLTISSMSGPALARKVRDDIVQKLFPVIRDVTTLDRFLSLLLTDAEPVRWPYSNGALRAAIIVHLAQRLGMRPREIHARVQPYFKRIAYMLLDAPNPSPGAFIERLIQDSSSRALPNSA